MWQPTTASRVNTPGFTPPRQEGSTSTRFLCGEAVVNAVFDTYWYKEKKTSKRTDYAEKNEFAKKSEHII